MMPSIADQGRDPAIKPVSVRTIIAVVATVWKVSIEDIISQRRHADLVQARFAAYWLARRLTPLSYPQIGRLIGNRDHTTVMHGVREVDFLITTSEAYARRLERVMSAIREAA